LRAWRRRTAARGFCQSLCELAGVVDRPDPPGATPELTAWRGSTEPGNREEKRVRSNSQTGPENSIKLRYLAQEDGGQGALLGRNEQGLWTDLSPPGAAPE